MFSFFFFNDTATTEIYTLSLHDALPIFGAGAGPGDDAEPGPAQRFGDGVAQARLVLDQQHPCRGGRAALALLDRKSTRLNSSHANISYAVFCLKKKKKDVIHTLRSIFNT